MTMRTTVTHPHRPGGTTSIEVPPPLRTTVSGVLKGAGGVVVSATTGVDYVSPSDERLSDSRTPTSHTHPNTEVTGLGGAAVLGVGTSEGTVCAGNDSRLSDARTPVSHTHAPAQIEGSSTVGQGLIVAPTASEAAALLAPYNFLSGFPGIIKRKSYAVADLPAAATVGAGAEAYCTDCLTPNGTGGYVQSDGTKWRLFNGLEATTDLLTYGRSRLTNGSSIYMTDREYSFSGFPSNSNGGLSPAGTATGGLTHLYSEYTGSEIRTGTSASGYGKINTPQAGSYPPLAFYSGAYGSCKMAMPAGASDKSTPEVYFVIAGFGLNISSNAVDSDFVGLIYDRANTWGHNATNLETWMVLNRKASSNIASSDTEVSPLFSSTLQLVEWLWNGSQVTIYISGSLVGTFSSNIPTSQLQPFIVRIGKTVGTTSRVVDVQRSCFFVRYA